MASCTYAFDICDGGHGELVRGLGVAVESMTPVLQRAWKGWECAFGNGSWMSSRSGVRMALARSMVLDRTVSWTLVVGLGSVAARSDSPLEGGRLRRLREQSRLKRFRASSLKLGQLVLGMIQWPMGFVGWKDPNCLTFTALLPLPMYPPRKGRQFESEDDASLTPLVG
jgi:hypothetical protein